MRIGMVSPYSWDVPGGVQSHVRDLSRALARGGHHVSVIAPGAGRVELVATTGRAMPVPYNGSVARVACGAVSTVRVRRWLTEGDFDVVHVHEPAAPSLSLLATALTDRPVVATYHADYTRSRALAVALPMIGPALRKVRVAIAVSHGAARTMSLQSPLRPLLIPNGIALADYRPVARGPVPRAGGCTLGFLGRGADARKGLAVLLRAFDHLSTTRPDVRLLVVGPTDAAAVRGRLAPHARDRVEVTGTVSDAAKVEALRRMDLLCAPNLGGESFGIVLAEAMAAGVPVLASDLGSFRAVLDGGAAGVLVAPGDWRALAQQAGALLDDADRRQALARAGLRTVAAYDWGELTPSIVAAYRRAVTGRSSHPAVGSGESLAG